MDVAQRCRIEFGLAAGESKRQIAKETGVSSSTVSREIRKHIRESFKGCNGRANQCVHRAGCKLVGVCADCPAGNASVPCVRCVYRNCNKFCAGVEYIDCPQRLERMGGVCNGCPDEKAYRKRKLFYVASRAQDEYRRDLSEKRQGAAQEQACLALSHVNSYVRLSQSDRTPFDVFEFLYGEGTAAKLHISRIDPKKIVLKPRLVGIEVR